MMILLWYDNDMMILANETGIIISRYDDDDDIVLRDDIEY